MNDVFTMNILDSFQDLTHVVHTVGFCVLEVLIYYPLKQLTTCNTSMRQNNYGLEMHVGFIFTQKFWFKKRFFAGKKKKKDPFEILIFNSKIENMLIWGAF